MAGSEWKTQKRAKERLMGYCPYGGCLGRCPQSRIDKGLQRGGDRAFCLICKTAGRTTKFRRALVQPSGSGGKPQAGSDDL